MRTKRGNTSSALWNGQNKHQVPADTNESQGENKEIKTKSSNILCISVPDFYMVYCLLESLCKKHELSIYKSNLLKPLVI